MRSWAWPACCSFSAAPPLSAGPSATSWPSLAGTFGQAGRRLAPPGWATVLVFLFTGLCQMLFALSLLAQAGKSTVRKGGHRPPARVRLRNGDPRNQDDHPRRGDVERCRAWSRVPHVLLRPTARIRGTRMGLVEPARALLVEEGDGSERGRSRRLCRNRGNGTPQAPENRLRFSASHVERLVLPQALRGTRRRDHSRRRTAGRREWKSFVYRASTGRCSRC